MLQPNVLGDLPPLKPSQQLEKAYEKTTISDIKSEVLTDIKDEQAKIKTLKTNSGAQSDIKDEQTKILTIKSIFLILGILSILPWYILLNAEGFFRKKLKNSDFEDNFAFILQATAVAANLLGSLSMFLLTKKFSPRTIAVVASITLSFPLVVVTALAKINTDSWAEEFFIIAVIMFCINSFSHGLITSAHSILCSMIQADILKIYYVGKGLSSLAGSALALVTLAFPSVDVVSAAFYYFLVVTVLTLVVATLLTIYLLNIDLVKQRTVKAIYQENEKTKSEELKPLKEIAMIVKAQGISAFILITSNLLVYPATLTNLESVNPKPGTPWSDKFFLPVTIFLVFAIGDNVGKILAQFVIWPTRELLPWISIVRLVLIPLTLMTNIQPRTIPVWFETDVVPSVLCFLTAFTAGYLLNLNVVYAPGYVEGKENKGRASMVIDLSIAAGLAVGSVSVFLIPPILNIK